MDCFYAAVEIRDNPLLIGKPVAVGGASDLRGVICTCNYVARKFGVHSAMATAKAYRLCPDLILLPVNMGKYRRIARHIHAIFREFTDLVEPLSLDEAYLDVSDALHHQGSATRIAEAIRERIWQAQALTASAGVSSNKLLAKIASGWKKPNGLFVIEPYEIEAFMQTLPVKQLYGVGKVTAQKLHELSLDTCFDIQQLSLSDLCQLFGVKRGQLLYDNSRGIDHRIIEPHRLRKSLSVEETFVHDQENLEKCAKRVADLFERLVTRYDSLSDKPAIKNQFVKIKFCDFKQVTAERASHELTKSFFDILLQESFEREKKPIRLLGLGVTFKVEEEEETIQQVLF